MIQGTKILLRKIVQPGLFNRLPHRTLITDSRSASHFSRSGVNVGFNRVQDFYYQVLQEDLMIMKYQYLGKEHIPEPIVKKKKTRFQGPTLDERGIKILKKGSIRAKRPFPLPIDPYNIPELERIHVQLTIKQALTNKFQLLSGYALLQAITGEKGQLIRVKTNNASFKLRRGVPFGVEVTLSGGAMYAFLDKLTEVVFPRIKEWGGLKITAGDGNGNLALGFPTSTVGSFPDIEIIYDNIPVISGLNVVFVTSAYRNANLRLLMSALQFPFVIPKHLLKSN